MTMPTPTNRVPGLPTPGEVKDHAKAIPCRMHGVTAGRWLTSDGAMRFLSVVDGIVVMNFGEVFLPSTEFVQQLQDATYIPLNDFLMPVDYAQVMEAARVRAMEDLVIDNTVLLRVNESLYVAGHLNTDGEITRSDNTVGLNPDGIGSFRPEYYAGWIPLPLEPIEGEPKTS